ncbi:hypothetical protein TEA_009539 [Camellia sinensis var. sinensis]|uniref:ABC transporter domain-containing protein n=1 Tax=Camellia sinensis var. sinensis TaxID=542762 RepID=A0A4S4CY54_CAMSN|nr:hypothetical protein TEA_009539 [Camellia sinensis var. sinensis]
MLDCGGAETDGVREHLLVVDVDDNHNENENENGIAILNEVETKIQIRNLVRKSDKGEAILSKVNLDIPKASIMGIIGPSGSGKSTVLRALNRLWEPPQGAVFLDGQDICSLDVLALRRKVGMLFQLPAMFTDPHPNKSGSGFGESGGGEEAVKAARDWRGGKEAMKAMGEANLVLANQAMEKMTGKRPTPKQIRQRLRRIRRWRRGGEGGERLERRKRGDEGCGRGESSVGKSSYGEDDREEVVKAAEKARIREGHFRSEWMWEKYLTKEGEDGKPKLPSYGKAKVLMHGLIQIIRGTVADNIRYGPQLRGKKLSDNEVYKLLTLADLDSSFFNKPSGELSVGQAQRVALARTLANEPEVLLLDEPTSALDPISTQNIEEVLVKLKKNEGLTVVMVSHSIKQIQRIADVVALLVSGEIVEVLNPHQLSQAKHPMAQSGDGGGGAGNGGSCRVVDIGDRVVVRWWWSLVTLKTLARRKNETKRELLKGIVLYLKECKE